MFNIKLYFYTVILTTKYIGRAKGKSKEENVKGIYIHRNEKKIKEAITKIKQQNILNLIKSKINKIEIETQTEKLQLQKNKSYIKHRR